MSVNLFKMIDIIRKIIRTYPFERKELVVDVRESIVWDAGDDTTHITIRATGSREKGFFVLEDMSINVIRKIDDIYEDLSITIDESKSRTLEVKTFEDDGTGFLTAFVGDKEYPCNKLVKIRHVVNIEELKITSGVTFSILQNEIMGLLSMPTDIVQRDVNSFYKLFSE